MIKSNARILAENAKRIAAMRKYVTQSKVAIPVDGELLKPTEVVALLQADVDRRTAVAATLAAYKAAVVDRDGGDAKLRAVDVALKGWVLARFGDQSTEALEFGYSARRAPTMTTATRAKSVELARATREARGTMGTRERLAIRGSLEPQSPEAAALSEAQIGG